MTFGNEAMPMVKDAAPGVAPKAKELLSYAKSLGLASLEECGQLDASGYRRFHCNPLELLVDVGNVSPSYQPGHAHADELNFLLFDNGEPLVVDTGISTYEKNDRRQLERSTQSHNCAYLPSHNSSQVWGGFRVARRAGVSILKESDTQLEACHNGYRHLGVMIYRSFVVEEKALIVSTRTVSKATTSVRQYLHFHPDKKVTLTDKGASVGNIRLTLSGFEEISKEKYMFASGFNQLVEAERIVLTSSSENTIKFSNVN